jgi:hypothetical protein
MTKRFKTDEEIDAMTPAQLSEHLRMLATISPPTQEDKDRWDEMSKEFVDNLNKNAN